MAGVKKEEAIIFAYSYLYDTDGQGAFTALDSNLKNYLERYITQNKIWEGDTQTQTPPPDAFIPAVIDPTPTPPPTPPSPKEDENEEEESPEETEEVKAIAPEQGEVGPVAITDEDITTRPPIAPIPESTPEPPVEVVDDTNNAPTDVRFLSYGKYSDYEIDEPLETIELGQISGTDPDGDTLTYSLGEGSHAGFSIVTRDETSFVLDPNIIGFFLVVKHSDPFVVPREEPTTITIPREEPTAITYEPISFGEPVLVSVTRLYFYSTAEELGGAEEVSAVIVATDEHGLTYEETVTFTIDYNEAPTDITFRPYWGYDDYEIDQPVETVNLGYFRSSDPENDKVTYSLGEGSHAGFSLVTHERPTYNAPFYGDIDLLTIIVLHPIGTGLYFYSTTEELGGVEEVSAVIIATDEHGASYEETFTFTIDYNEAPTDILFYPRTAYSNSKITPLGETLTIGSLVGIDEEDYSGDLTFSFGEGSHVGFSLYDSDRYYQTLTFRATQEEVEGLDEVRAVIVVTDSHGASYEETYTFAIKHEEDNQAPTDIRIIMNYDVVPYGEDSIIADKFQDGDVFTYYFRKDVDKKNKDLFEKVLADVLQKEKYEGITAKEVSGNIAVPDLTIKGGGTSSSHNVDSYIGYIDYIYTDWFYGYLSSYSQRLNKSPEEIEAYAERRTTSYIEKRLDSLLEQGYLTISSADMVAPRQLLVGTLRTTDADSKYATFTYSLDSDSHSGFSIGTFGGRTELRFTATPDIEHGETISAIVIVADEFGATYEETITFTIDNENAAPDDIVFIPKAAYADYEIILRGGRSLDLGIIEGIDADGDRLSYALVDGSSSMFYLGFRGDGCAQLYFRGNADQLEDGDEVSATIRITDRNGESYEEAFTFTLIHPNYAPSDITFTQAADSTGTLLGILSTSDSNKDDTHIYSLDATSAAAGFLIQGDTLHFTGEIRPASVTITTTDDDGLSYAETFADIL